MTAVYTKVVAMLLSRGVTKFMLQDLRTIKTTAEKKMFTSSKTIKTQTN